MSLDRRLEALEERAMPRRHVSEAKPSDARCCMVEHLDRLAALRRGELGPTEASRVQDMSAAAESRFASRRGEGA